MLEYFRNMKKEIHPTYYPKAAIQCACGKKHTIGSTKEKIEVEICAACHPFFTGKGRLIDTAGRVEKFRAKRERAKATLATKTKKPQKKR